MVDYLDFTEEKLELGYDYGAVGGMRFKTTIIKKGDKQEQRNVDWWLPLGRWQLGERTLLQSDLALINEVSQIRDFHEARKGSKQGFRFKDWTDYKGINQHLGTADGQQDQWQLKKTYVAGNHQTLRPITKPVSGTVKVYLNGIETVEGWTVDYSTGILTFDTPPPNGTLINCDFEFDVPVWFESDEFSLTLEGYQKNHQTAQVEAIYRLGNLAVEEGRIPLALPWYSLEPVPQKLSATLELGIIDATVIKNRFDTSQENLASGYVRRDENILLPERIVQLGQKNWNQAELEQLLGFFWNSKGRAIDFDLSLNNELLNGRFDIDNLAIKFLVTDNQDSLYNISGLKFFLDSYAGIFNYLDPETYIKFYIDSSGSMDDHIPIVSETANQLSLLIKKIIFQDDEAKFNKYYQGIQLIGDERWLRWLSFDLRERATEPDKVFFLVWINEADAIYHQTSPTSAPTSSYLSDLTSFINNYANRDNFGSIIYGVKKQGIIFDAFAGHLINAHEGRNGYSPALKDYDVFIRPYVPSTVNANYYLNDLVTFA